MKLKQGSLGLVLSVTIPTCFAATPATTQYVDAQFNAVKAQIANITPGVAHPVGSCYGGGVVYYVNPDANAVAGNRGLIVSLTDAGSPSTYAWGLNPTDPVVSTSAKYFSGLTNTANILAYSPTPANFAAAYAANVYTSIATCDTCTAWYLPAQDELATLYYQSTNITGFGGTCANYSPPAATGYWSSTQLATTNAWGVNFGNGFVATSFLDNSLRVRPVRAF